MDLSNKWDGLEIPNEVVIEATPFENLIVEDKSKSVDDSWRRVIPMINQLRNSEYADNYTKDSMDSATSAAALFASKLSESLLKREVTINFDIQMDESVEISFNGRQKARVNLMLDAINTHEEAFLCYQRDGHLTQTNGYMSEVIEILNNIL